MSKLASDSTNTSDVLPPKPTALDSNKAHRGSEYVRSDKADSEVSDISSTQTSNLNKANQTKAEKTLIPPTTSSAINNKQDTSVVSENAVRTTKTTDEMQSPKIYDTKKYFIPINETRHNHGHVGIIVAGILSALIVAGIVVVAAWLLT